MRIPIVALVGRPNVGKSTLFNRLIGERRSIVEDEPGTTRDRLYGTASGRAGRSWWWIPAGWMWPRPRRRRRRAISPRPWSSSSRDFVREIRQQAEVAIKEADVVVFLVDAKDGITAADRDVAEILRRSGRPVVVWRSTRPTTRRGGRRRWSSTSSAWARSIRSRPCTAPAPATCSTRSWRNPRAEEEPPADAVRIAIVGRPNVGKSSLLNALLQVDRSIVSPVAGTTRDAIDTELLGRGRR